MSSISILIFLTQTHLGILRTSMFIFRFVSELDILNLKKSSSLFLMKDHLLITKYNKKGFLFGYNPFVNDLECPLSMKTAIRPFFANNHDGKLYKIDASYIKISENQIQHSILFLPLWLLYFYRCFSLEIKVEGGTEGFKLSKTYYS